MINLEIFEVTYLEKILIKIRLYLYKPQLSQQFGTNGIFRKVYIFITCEF